MKVKSNLKQFATSITVAVCLGSMGTLAIANKASALNFLGSSSGAFGTVDTQTGNFQLIGNTRQFFDIAYDSGPLAYGITGNRRLYSIDISNANTTFIGNTGVFVNALGFDNAGNLFGAGNNKLYRGATRKSEMNLKKSDRYSIFMPFFG